MYKNCAEFNVFLYKNRSFQGCYLRSKIKHFSTKNIEFFQFFIEFLLDFDFLSRNCLFIMYKSIIHRQLLNFKNLRLCFHIVGCFPRKTMFGHRLAARFVIIFNFLSHSIKQKSKKCMRMCLQPLNCSNFKKAY